MKLENRTPFSIVWIPGRIRYPGHSLTVIAKGTFDLTPGATAQLAAVQLPIEADVDSAGLPYYDSDFAYLKPRADRLLVGRCFAPQKAPTRECQVGLTVGTWSRRLRIVGDRQWSRGLLKTKATDPIPFVDVPLGYDRSFGGPQFAPNPIGRGFYRTSPSSAQELLLPNVEDPAMPIKSPADLIAPAGFGPVSRTWAPRRNAIGTYGDEWFQTRCPWLPADVDWGVYNGAPVGTQPEGYLHGDEMVVLENLDRDVPRFEARLPGLRTRCFAERLAGGNGAEFVEIEMKLDTLWIDADLRKMVLVWRGNCDVVSEEYEDLDCLYVVPEALTSAPESREVHRRKLLSVPTPPADGRAEGRNAGPLDGDGEGAESVTAGPEAARTGGAGRGSAESLETADSPTTPGVDDEAEHLGAEVAADEAADAGVDLDPRAVAEELRAKLTIIASAPEQTPELLACRAEILETIAGIDALLAMGENAPSAAPPPPAPWTRETVLAAIEAGQSLDGESLANLDLSLVDFRSISVRGADLRGVNLRRAVLSGSVLDGADLTSSDLREAVLIEASFGGAVLRGAFLAAADGSRADFRNANLEGADLSESNLEEASFSSAGLRGALLERVRAARSNWADACLDEVRASQASLPGADLAAASARRARFDRADLREASLDGIQAEGVDLNGAVLELANAAAADFQKATLIGAQANGSSWTKTRFDDADLGAADFIDADLTKVSFRRANLSAADFTRAILRRADFEGAVVRQANFFRAMLPAARLDRADFSESNLFESDLADATVLEGRFDGANVKRTRFDRRRTSR